MKKEAVSALIIAFCILLAYALPYTLLENVAVWYGSFLLWIILAVIVIFITYYLTKDWGSKS